MGTTKKQETRLMRVSARTPDMMVQIVKMVAVLSNGEVLTKADAIEYVLNDFLDNNSIKK